MAKFVKSREKIVLTLAWADIWKAWCEKRNYFKTPVQVAEEKGLVGLKLTLDQVAAIKTLPLETGVEVTYFLNLEAVFFETSMV